MEEIVQRIQRYATQPGLIPVSLASQSGALTHPLQTSRIAHLVGEAMPVSAYAMAMPLAADVASAANTADTAPARADLQSDTPRPVVVGQRVQRQSRSPNPDEGENIRGIVQRGGVQREGAHPRMRQSEDGNVPLPARLQEPAPNEAGLSNPSSDIGLPATNTLPKVARVAEQSPIPQIQRSVRTRRVGPPSLVQRATRNEAGLTPESTFPPQETAPTARGVAHPQRQRAASGDAALLVRSETMPSPQVARASEKFSVTPIQRSPHHEGVPEEASRGLIQTAPLQRAMRNDATAAPARAALPVAALPMRRAVTQSAPATPALQRAALPTPPPNAAPSQTSATATLPTVTAQPAPPQMDVGRLAEQVYELLVQRLSAERERRGY